jgi:hypothetical protein
MFAFRHVAGDMADHRAALVEAGRVGRDVRMLAQVARGVLEIDVGEAARDGVRGLAVAEGGGEDHVRAVEDHLRDDPLGIRAFGHAFGVDGLDRVAEGFLDGEAALVVGPGPAVVADRADIDEADGERVVLRRRRCRRRGRGQRGGGQCLLVSFIWVLSSVLDFVGVREGRRRDRGRGTALSGCP